jgi:hypothetical protein
LLVEKPRRVSINLPLASRILYHQAIAAKTLVESVEVSLREMVGLIDEPPHLAEQRLSLPWIGSVSQSL